MLEGGDFASLKLHTWPDLSSITHCSADSSLNHTPYDCLYDLPVLVEIERSGLADMCMLSHALCMVNTVLSADVAHTRWPCTGTSQRLNIWQVLYPSTVAAASVIAHCPVHINLLGCQVSRIWWPSTGRGRTARPGGLPLLFGSAMTVGGVPSAHDGMPAEPGNASRFLSGPTLVPTGHVMFAATCTQHGGRLTSGMQGASPDSRCASEGVDSA